MMQEEYYLHDRADDEEVSVVGGRTILSLTDTSQYSRLNFQSNSPDLNIKTTKIHLFEIFVACVIGLSTISGGILEGYTSPAIPNLLLPANDTLAYNISRNLIPFNNSHTNITIEEKVQHLNTSSINDEDVTTTTIFTDTTDSPVTDDDVASTTISLNAIKNSFDSLDVYLTEDEASWFGSLLLLGACIGSTISSWCVSMGRKKAILESALPRIIGWILIACGNNLAMLYAGRVLAGISLGIVTSAAPLYISEISHPSSRGSLGCIVQLGVNTGIFLAAVMGTFLGWRELAIFGAVSVAFYFVATWFIPNSPSWSVIAGKTDEAKASLCRLRGDQYNVDSELQQIIATNSKKPTELSWKNMFREKRCLTPLGIVLLVTLVNRCSGYNAIITYCASFLHDAVPTFSEYWAAAAVTAIQVAATAIAALLVDRIGRRILLLTSVISMALSLLVIAVCDLSNNINAGGSVIALMAMMAYVGTYSVGIGPLTWVLVGEMFPLDAREKASAIIAFFNWFTAFVITKTYFRMETVLGISGTCLVYSVICLVGALFIYLLVPETKGKTLSEIEVYFSYPMKTILQHNGPRKDNVQYLANILDRETSSPDSYSTFNQYQTLQ